MIKINNLEDEKTQETLWNLGFYKRENYYKGVYNIWIKEVKLDDWRVGCKFLINTNTDNDGFLRINFDHYEEYGDIDAVSIDNELDFLMQLFNSGLSITIVNK